MANIFSSLKSWWWSRMITKSFIAEKADAQPVTSDEILKERELWRRTYEGKAEWNDKHTPSLHLASGICVQVARAVTLELKCKIIGSVRAEYLDSQFTKVIDGLRTTVEKCCAGGEMIFRTFIRNGEIHVTVVENDCYIPLEYDELGELVKVRFIEKFTDGKKYYTLHEDCAWENGVYTIANTTYVSGDAKTLGFQTPITEIERWAKLEPLITIEAVKAPWFVLFKMPQANHIKRNVPEGVAIFSKAVGLIKEADKQFARLIWENEGGELAVEAAAELFRKTVKSDPLNPRNNITAIELPKGKERLFRTNNASVNEFPMTVFSPELRDESLHRTFDRILRRIEFACGLSYGLLSDPQTIERSATEVRAGKQQFYSTVSDIQRAAQTALERLAAVMDEMTDVFGLAPDGEYEISLDWDDSILADREAEFKEKAVLAELGVISKQEFRAWYLNVPVDSDEAKNLPGLYPED